MNKILICDDEADIVDAIEIYLNAEGYETVKAYNGIEAVEIASKEDVELVLLDVMMPKMDGMEAMTKLRKLKNIPIIMLTAKSEDADKISGLNMGADDYMTKPFNPAELIARVRSQLRRYTQLGGIGKDAEQVKVGGVELDDRKKEVHVDGELVNLTPTEYEILKVLITSPDTVMSPKEIYRKVWMDMPLGAESTVAVHIRHIREKIEINPAEPEYVKVVWGKGYKFNSGKRRE